MVNNRVIIIGWLILKAISLIEESIKIRDEFIFAIRCIMRVLG
jgi:hypothetical protein